MTKRRQFPSIEDPIALLEVGKKTAQYLEALLASTFGEAQRQKGSVEFGLCQYSKCYGSEHADTTMTIRGGATNLKYCMSESELVGTAKSSK